MTVGGVHQIADAFDHRHPDDLVFLKMGIDSGLSGTSPIVTLYEEKLADLYSTPRALAVASGTASVAVALAAFKVEGGGEVIVPPTCPICTVFPILMHGLKPVFCDVLPNSFGLDPDQVAKAITSRTIAIIEVPMWGYPTQVDALRNRVIAYGVPLILDLAHAHLCRLNNQWLADYAEVACFSTHEGKQMSTGEGGFVLTSDASLDSRMRAFTRFGNLDGRRLGLNFKLNGLQAAVGLARIQAIKNQLTVRLKNRAYIISKLNNPAIRELPITNSGELNGYALLLQTTRSDGRHFVDYLADHGVPSDVKKYDNQPLYNYPLLARFASPCPNAVALLRSLTTVPLHPGLSDQELNQIVEVVNDYLP